MKLSKNERGLKIVIYGQAVDQVNKFTYLGAWIMNEVRCDTKIRTRIGMAKDTFNSSS